MAKFKVIFRQTVEVGWYVYVDENTSLNDVWAGVVREEFTGEPDFEAEPGELVFNRVEEIDGGSK